ncbi:MAG: hypothetical protein COB53_07665 [Elusimicrobia bacterium]|nr:MAG: hypothetical protein COB53_07665 [Elusimicrobiota bacterium]
MRWAALLILFLGGCAGNQKRDIAPMVAEGARFAIFSGAYFAGKKKLGAQLLSEHADQFVLRSLSGLVGGAAGSRFVANDELIAYGRNFLPIQYSKEGFPCDPRTASLVSERTKADAFVVLWTTDWPPSYTSLEGSKYSFGGAGSTGGLLGIPFKLAAYSTKDCRRLGEWTVTVGSGWTFEEEYGDRESKKYARRVANKIFKSLQSRLNLPPQ